MKTIADKMAARGVDALTDRELLSLLTEDEQSAEALLAAYGGSLARVGSEEAARLRMIGGLGLRRARMLLAAAEARSADEFSSWLRSWDDERDAARSATGKRLRAQKCIFTRRFGVFVRLGGSAPERLVSRRNCAVCLQACGESRGAAEPR